MLLAGEADICKLDAADAHHEWARRNKPERGVTMRQFITVPIAIGGAQSKVGQQGGSVRFSGGFDRQLTVDDSSDVVLRK